ncbi:hypothetical protein [Neolewinella xylanilytica]|nr:hypothetical protein [Neolewinella xylanilytica]
MEVVAEAGPSVSSTSLESIQQKVDGDRLMRTISYLADVHGPRLLGTPNYYNAVEWLRGELKTYGVDTV